MHNRSAFAKNHSHFFKEGSLSMLLYNNAAGEMKHLIRETKKSGLALEASCKTYLLNERNELVAFVRDLKMREERPRLSSHLRDSKKSLSRNGCQDSLARCRARIICMLLASPLYTAASNIRSPAQVWSSKSKPDGQTHRGANLFLFLS